MIATNKPARGWRPTDGSEPPKPWRERLQDMRTAYGNIPGAFRLVWGADKRSTIVMAALTLVSAFLPLSQAWAAGLGISCSATDLSPRSSTERRRANSHSPITYHQ